MEGTNATDIICHSYKPRVTINSIEKRTQVHCYITLPRYAAEPNVINPGQSWWQMLPQIEISFDPWDDTNVTALFLPDTNEHPNTPLPNTLTS